MSFRSNIRIPVLSKDDMKIITQQMEKCVCQIILEMNQGTGFFCYIPFLDNPKLPVLMTSNQVLNGKDLFKSKKAILSINENKKIVELIFDGSRKYFSDKNNYVIIIEIKPQDNINSDSFWR